MNSCDVAVIGESIIDLIPNKQGLYQACVGGSPYNVARALGLQQALCTYLSPFSRDSFGQLLLREIERVGVEIDPGFRVDKPTSIAIVSFDVEGLPYYQLYRDGVADREYLPSDVIKRFPRNLKLLHTGSLAIVPDDLSRITEVLIAAKSRGILVSIDLNVRLNVVDDPEAYADGIRSLLPLCDILKASTEDLQHLGFQDDIESTINEFLEITKGGLVAITDGEQGACLANRHGQVNLEALSPEHMGDSVGAGDCFHAGMIAALCKQKSLSREWIDAAVFSDLQGVLVMASASAAINVSRRGCNPPTTEEVLTFVKKSAIPLHQSNLT